MSLESRFCPLLYGDKEDHVAYYLEAINFRVDLFLADANSAIFRGW